MPAHTLASVFIQIEQAGVVPVPRCLFDQVFDVWQRSYPGPGHSGLTGIGVRKLPITVPGNFALRELAFGIDDDFITLPMHRMEQCAQIPVCLRSFEQHAKVSGIAVTGQKLAGKLPGVFQWEPGLNIQRIAQKASITIAWVDPVHRRGGGMPAHVRASHACAQHPSDTHPTHRFGE